MIQFKCYDKGLWLNVNPMKFGVYRLIDSLIS